jgi:hypothetical protein
MITHPFDTRELEWNFVGLLPWRIFSVKNVKFLWSETLHFPSQEGNLFFFCHAYQFALNTRYMCGIHTKLATCRGESRARGCDSWEDRQQEPGRNVGWKSVYSAWDAKLSLKLLEVSILLVGTVLEPRSNIPTGHGKVAAGHDAHARTSKLRTHRRRMHACWLRHVRMHQLGAGYQVCALHVKSGRRPPGLYKNPCSTCTPCSNIHSLHLNTDGP